MNNNVNMLIFAQFDLANSKLDMTSLIEQDAGRVILHQVPGIARCLLSDNKGKLQFKTEGVNITVSTTVLFSDFGIQLNLGLISQVLKGSESFKD